MLCSGQPLKSDIEKDDYEKNFEEVPDPFTQEERDAWLKHLSEVVVSSRSSSQIPCFLFNIVTRHVSRLDLNPERALLTLDYPGDAFFPFVDNVLRASRSGVKYIAAPTGSQADKDVIATAEKLHIIFVEQSVRLFHH